VSKDERVFITRIRMFEFYDEGTYTVVKLCRLFAISRTWFYKLKKRREASGDEGLRSASRKPESFANQTPLEDELVVLDFLTEYPSYGPERVSSELGRRGLLRIGHTAVYGIMKRRDLNTKKKRLEWVRVLSGKVVKLSDLERDKQRSKSRHIEASYPGSLVGVDVCYIGCLKNMGRIYQFTGCDCFSSFGWAKLYFSKTVKSAIDFLETDLLPKAGNVGIQSVLHDNGKEFTTHWPNARHKFKQACARNSVSEKFTKVRHPWTNGYAERLNQTILDEFYSVALRKKIYTSLQELQKDLNAFMLDYNFRRSHQGYKLKENGYLTPSQGFFCGRTCLALPAAA